MTIEDLVHPPGWCVVTSASIQLDDMVQSVGLLHFASRVPATRDNLLFERSWIRVNNTSIKATVRSNPDGFVVIRKATGIHVV